MPPDPTRPIYTPPPSDSDADLDEVERAFAEYVIGRIVEEFREDAATVHNNASDRGSPIRGAT